MIDSQVLPSWGAVFQLIGEPQPRRGRARCPIHNGDSPTSLSLSEEKGVYHCHVSHSSGDKLDFVQRTMGINFVGALSMLGMKAEKQPKPDPAIVRQHAAMKIIRDWCRQTSRQLRIEYLMRHRIERCAKQKLVVDSESLTGWELLRIAYDGQQKTSSCRMKLDCAVPTMSGFTRGGYIGMISEPPITVDEINELTGNLSFVGDTGSTKATNPKLPCGFRLTETGLYLIGEDEKPDIFICGPLEVVGHTRDRHNESWGRLLTWH